MRFDIKTPASSKSHSKLSQDEWYQKLQSMTPEQLDEYLETEVHNMQDVRRVLRLLLLKAIANPEPAK